MSLTDHKVNEEQPHWKDFYCNNEEYIEIVEIRKNRKLAVLNIRCRDNDNAPYIFFIHGACARMSQFEGLIKNLSPKFNIIAFDRIGCGLSHKPKEYDTYNDSNIFIDLCLLFEKYLPQSSSLINKKHEILIISHSFGCQQTIKLLSKFGNSSNYNYLIRSVVLIGPPSLILGKSMPWMLKKLFSLPHWILDYLSPSLSASFRKNAIHSSSTHIHDLELTFAGHNKPFMFSSFYLQIEPCNDTQLQSFANFNVNTLIINGQHDKITTIKHAQQLVEKLEICRSQQNKENLIELKIIQDTSHQCMQEKPDKVTDFIMQFWDKSKV